MLLIMKKVIVYSGSYCPFCVRAKRLLQQKNVPFEEILLDDQPEELIALREKTGHRTIPQIFIGDHFVGGFTELAELESKGLLDQLLSGAETS